MAGPKRLDYISAILDEIALEGLDGITIEGLFLRLTKRPHFTFPLDKYGKTFLWRLLVTHDDIDFYQLPVPRKPLVIYNRYDLVDPDIGTVLEPAVKPDELYPHHLINDVANKVKGSCLHYYERVSVRAAIRDEGLSLEQADERWGMSLVIVASQSLREDSLMGCSVDPFVELSAIRHCILEQIGRSRYQGEVTQSITSLHMDGEDSKSLFYHRKYLSCLGIITKQVHHQRVGKQNCSGSLLHLPRFYVERNSKTLMITQRVVAILRTRPNNVAEYEEIRKELGMTTMLKKLFKTPDFRRFVKVDQKLPYRSLYPEAKVREWKRKGNDMEKTIRAIQLINPDVEDTDIWYKDEEVDTEVEPPSRELPRVPLLHDRSILHQAFYVVDKAGPDGASQIELANMMGVSKLQARTICRNLLRVDLVSTFMNDIGRQRVTRYMSKRYINDSKLALQFRREKAKMYSLMGNRKKNLEMKKNKKNKQQRESKSSKKKTVKGGVKKECVYKETVEPTTSKKRKVKTSLFPEKVNGPQIKKLKLGSVEQQSCTATAQVSTVVDVDLPLKNLSAYQEVPGIIPLTESKTTEASAVLPSIPLTKKDSVSVVPLSVESLLQMEECDDGGLEDEQQEPVGMQHIETKICELADGDFGVNENVCGFVEEFETSYPAQRKDSPGVTYRLLKRANMIIESVQTHKVVDDLGKLMKMINEVEDQEGYLVKMDKKSLLRLLLKLNKDKNIKFYRIQLKSEVKEKTLNFVCLPHISYDHSIIQSAIEQEKMKFFLVTKASLLKPNEKSVVKEDTVSSEVSELFDEQINKSVKELKAMSSKVQANTFVYDRLAGKKYGFCPKFIRMRTLHQFMYYVIYGYKGDENLDQNEVVNAVRSTGVSISKSDIASLPRAYLAELNWMTFIPSLPKHAGWPDGWAIICDILLRIPLSVFVKIFNVTYNVPQLSDYLAHPIRRHYLLKCLPLHMRNNLMVARKYIFSFHEVVQRLCYIGLAQFGPQRLKEKDQVFIYLNRKTSLLDTTGSKPGYHQVSQDVEYVKHIYEFNNMNDIDKYWYEMWHICLHTRLGGRLCMTGMDITLEVLQNKEAMIQAVQARTPFEAPQLDTGAIPGDAKGAAGLDSALFSHLKRNWNWTNTHNTDEVSPAIEKSSVSDIEPPMSLREARLANLEPGKAFDQQDADPAESKENDTEMSKKRVTGKKMVTPVKAKPLETMKRRRVTSVVRTFKPLNKPIRPIRPWYDDIDKKTEGSMTRRRVKWSEDEDNLLLLCKVGMIYLCPNPRKQLINFQAVRDVCHSAMPSTRNKTSRACQRRILTMMKNKMTVKNVTLHLEEVKQDEFINHNFGKVVIEARAKADDLEEVERIVCEKYKVLVGILLKKFNSELRSELSSQAIIIPDTNKELLDAYEVMRPPDTMKKKGSFHEARNIVDVHCATVSTIVHSTLCCLPDKTSFMYQLFKIYQQYPDNLLRSVMAKLRADQMVSLRKTYVQMLHKTGNYLPVSSLPYQLSISYFYLLQTKYDHNVFGECHQMRKKLVSYYERNPVDLESRGMECADLDGGSAALLVELFCLNSVTLNLEIPENIVILDPRIGKTDEAYVKFLERYQEIVRSCKLTRTIPESASIFTRPSFISPADINAQVDVVPQSSQVNSCHFNVKEIKRYTMPTNNDDSSESEDLSEEEEDKEEESREPQVSIPLSTSTQYTIARAASRIALFSMRDDFLLGKTGQQVTEKQHAHDFLVVNSCKVHCELRRPETRTLSKFFFLGSKSCSTGRADCNRSSGAPREEELQQIIPSMRDTCNQIIKDIKSCMVVPETVVLPEEAYKVFTDCGLSSQDWRQACLIVRFIQSKKEVGATIAELRDKFATLSGDKTLSELLHLLTSTRFVSRVGVTTLHYVYQKFLKPWLLHSYKIKRLQREKLPLPVNLAMKRKRDASTEVGNENIEHVGGVKKRKSRTSSQEIVEDEGETKESEELRRESEVDKSNVEEKFVIRAYTEDASKACKGNTNNELRVGSVTAETASESCLAKGQEISNIKVVRRDTVESSIDGNIAIVSFETNKKSKEPNMKQSEAKLVGVEISLETSKGITQIDDNLKCDEVSESERRSTVIYSVTRIESSGLENVVVTPEMSEVVGSIGDTLGDLDKEDTSGEAKCDGAVTSEELITGNKGNEILPTTRDGRRSGDDKAESSTEDKLLETPLGQFTPDMVVCNVDISATETVNVLIRPWIRVDGTLNRRVLDRMLGSVLGHCMSQPGTSVRKVMDRFSPALQPIHTREILEILQKLGCLYFQVVVKSWQPTLFSKPSPITIGVSDGTEDESVMVVKLAVDAITRLSTFIGDKAYKKDFLGGDDRVPDGSQTAKSRAKRLA